MTSVFYWLSGVFAMAAGVDLMLGQTVEVVLMGGVSVSLLVYTWYLAREAQRREQ